MKTISRSTLMYLADLADLAESAFEEGLDADPVGR